MLAFPSMLLSAAEQAGMKTPELGDNDEFDMNEFPHFAVFCNAQLGRRMSDMGEHWGNAKIIADIPEHEIRTITLGGLIDRGLSFSS